MKVKVLGVTGGIGSGKSIVCRVFSQLGVPVYEADAETKILYASNVHLQNKLRELFPEELFGLDGVPDLRLFASYFFTNESELHNLNRLVHPFVREHFQKWLMKHEDLPYVIKEAAILFESGSYQDCDKVVNVSAPERLRIQRVVERDRRSIAEIRKIIQRQLPDEERSNRAGFVIINDETRLVIPQVLSIHKQMLKLAKG